MGPCRAHKDLVLKLSEHQVAILGRNCLWQPCKARHSIPNQQRGPVPFSTSRETRKGVWSDAPSKDEMSRECSWGSPGFTTAKESQLEKTASTQVTRCGAESEPVSGICRDEGLWSCHSVQVDTTGLWVTGPVFLDMARRTLWQNARVPAALVLCVAYSSPPCK